MVGVKGRSGRPKRDPIERLREDVRRAQGSRSSEACWPWPKSLDEYGYGKCYMGDRGGKMIASRAVYEHFVGPLIKTLVVMHTCDNPRCVNPEHLMLGSVADNNRDAHRKGRQPSRRGGRNPSSKLSEDAVRFIRSADVSQRGAKAALARLFAVSPATITLVLKSANWKDL